MDESILDADQVENLIKFCPTKDEMELLKVNLRTLLLFYWLQLCFLALFPLAPLPIDFFTVISAKCLLLQLLRITQVTRIFWESVNRLVNHVLIVVSCVPGCSVLLFDWYSSFASSIPYCDVLSYVLLYSKNKENIWIFCSSYIY